MLRLLSVIISLALISGQAVSQTQQKPPSSSKGSITGRIVCEDGQVPANIRVTVWSPRDRRSVSRQAVIDSAGRFQADDLAPIAYMVAAYAPGYINAEGVNPQKIYRIGDTVTLKLMKGGVITGLVTDANGEPVSGVQVRAIRVRDHEGRRIHATSGVQGRQTDDRGVYRIYGLQPGSYLVVTSALFKSSSETDALAPTYHPSSTRDAAAEVLVQSGQEASNIDIRFRNERGYSVSGTVTGPLPQGARMNRVWVSLSHTDMGTVESTSIIVRADNRYAFEIHGVPDGEYRVTARSMSGREGADETASPAVQAVVKGADVTGLELRLAPLGSISGRIVLEPALQKDQLSDCKEKRVSVLEESIITVRRDLAKNERPSVSISSPDVAPDDKGEFKFAGLQPSRYRIESRLPGELWYVRSITLPAPGNTTKEISANGIAIKQGEKVIGLTITISEGAASMRGKLVAPEGASLPSRLRVHLISAERESVEDLLRYREVAVESDSTFALTNLAPGKYLIIARPTPEGESGLEIARPAHWDAAARKKLRSEAEAANTLIDLKPCARLSDYLLRYARPEAARPARNGL